MGQPFCRYQCKWTSAIIHWNISKYNIQLYYQRNFSTHHIPSKSALKDGGFHFVYLPLDAAVDILSKIAIDVLFNDGTNAFDEKYEQCSLRFTDSAENYRIFIKIISMVWTSSFKLVLNKETKQMADKIKEASKKRTKLSWNWEENESRILVNKWSEENI